MKRRISWLYWTAYCISSGCLGAFVGAVAGVAIAMLVMRPEEAVVLTTGVFYGGPVGAIVGVLMSVFAIRRREKGDKSKPEP